MRSKLTSKVPKMKTLSYLTWIRIGEISGKNSFFSWILIEAVVTSESYRTNMNTCINRVIKKDVIGYN